MKFQINIIVWLSYFQIKFAGNRTLKWSRRINKCVSLERT